MLPSEPVPTAALLAVLGALLGLSALLSRALGRLGIPVAVLFLFIGMLAGTSGLFGFHFANYHLAFRLGTVALVLILFDGGLNTPMGVLKTSLAPATLLATLGVAGTAVVVGGLAHFFGMPWREAVLLGAIVSSTDAAAVFTVLRGSGLQLKRRVGATLELESGLNDPMAVILTLTLTSSLVGGHPFGALEVGHLVLQLVVGAVLGAAIGLAGRWLIRRIQPFAGGLFPVMTFSIACLAFGAPTLVYGSGFLAVYVAGVVVGQGPLPYHTGLLRVHDFLAWFAQVVMFLALGLLTDPARLVGVAGLGLAVSLGLAVVARPLMVLLCLLPFRYRLSEMLYVGWVGLRGAVPIILAIYPILAGAPGATRIFDVVFFVVVVSAVVQGGSVRWLTPRRLLANAPPPAPAALEIVSTKMLAGEVIAFYIDRASAVHGATIEELPFPTGAAAMLIIRGDELLAPRGATRLSAGDHVYVFCRPEDRPFIMLLFGRPEEE